tara:strand:+ start:119 stop:388 length:270 start_codon:yes stop_codon:yes gene_type:complete
MTSKQETPVPTPENVAKLATEKATLTRTALIGVFGSEANLSALIRGFNGDIARVTVGDSFDRSLVSAISKDSLILARGGKTKVLKLPRT